MSGTKSLRGKSLRNAKKDDVRIRADRAHVSGGHKSLTVGHKSPRGVSESVDMFSPGKYSTQSKESWDGLDKIGQTQEGTVSDPDLKELIDKLGPGTPLACDFEAIYSSEKVQNDTLKDTLFDLASDEITVVQKEWQPQQGMVADDLEQMSKTVTKRVVKAQLEFFKNGYSTLKRAHESSDSLVSIHMAEPESLPSRTYESADTPDITEEGAKDELRHELPDVKVPRFPLFSLIRGVPRVEPAFTPSREPFTEIQGRQFLFHPKDIKFALGEFEAFFLRAAVYEIAPGKLKRLSEDYTFDMCAKELTPMLSKNKCFSQSDTDEKGHAAVFTLTKPNVDQYLVLRVEKLYETSMRSVADLYVKGESSSKDSQKWIKQTSKMCANMDWKAPFVYAILPLFDSSLQFIGNAGHQFLSFNRCSFSGGEIGDELLYSIFNDPKTARSTLTTKKGKSISVSFTCSFNEMTTKELSLLHDTSLVYVQEFTLAPLPVPALSCVNDLYIYPSQLTLPKGMTKAVVFIAEFMDDKGLPLPVFYGGLGSAMKTEARSNVGYNGKPTSFYDEIKLRMPLELTRAHHLLFTFYELQEISKAPKAIKFGKAKFFLLDGNGKFSSSGTLDLTVMQNNGRDSIDQGRVVFSLQTRINSSVLTRSALEPIFAAIDAGSLSVLQIANVMNVEPLVVIKFMPVLMDGFWTLICNKHAAREAFYVFTSFLERMIHDAGAFQLLMSYAEHNFTRALTRDHWMHREIATQWFALLKQLPKKGSESLLRPAPFLFQIILRSMTAKLKDDKADSSRTSRFDPDFMKHLEGLLIMLAWQLRQRSEKGTRLMAVDLTRNISLFVRDLFALMDRGFVFKMISGILEAMSGKSEVLSCVELKLTFLRILTEYKYWVALNLPLPGEIASARHILAEFRSKHFLASTFLSQVTSYFGHEEEGVRLKTVTTLAQLFVRHEFDARFVDKPEAKRRIANVYFPFLLIVSDNIASIKANMEFGERRLLFGCALWLLKNIEPMLLRKWWAKEGTKRMISFFDVLAQCLKTFEFVGKEELEKRMGASQIIMQNSATKNALENFYTNAENFYTQKKDQPQSQGNTRKFASARQHTRTLGSADGPKAGEKTQENVYEFDEKVESNLNTEASLIILDCCGRFLALFEQAFESSNVASKQCVVLDKFLRLLLEFLKRHQSVAFLQSYFATLRSFVDRYPNYLFSLEPSNGSSSPCGPLCLLMVKLSSYSSYEIRSQASVLLFEMLSGNYKTCGNIVRMSTEIVVALTKLLGTSGIPDATYYRKGITAIFDYVKQTGDSKFIHLVKFLMARVFRLLDFSVQLVNEAHDPEMTADLYHSIALDYKNMPNLRVAWLESLANSHQDYGFMTEAAMCWVHIAALVGEVLELEGAGAHQFAALSPNAVEEASFFCPSLADHPEDVYLPSKFSTAMYLDVLQRLADLLKEAQMFEAASQVYNILAPIWEQGHQYDKLVTLHEDWKEVFESIVKCNQTESRMFGTYFRVAFFGPRFAALEDEEFVYKEPKLSKLGTIIDRLKSIHGDDVNFIRNSGEVAEGEEGVQITKIFPYFDEEDDKLRTTYYEHNTKIKQFWFETPFVKGEASGKTVADHAKDQWLRKTILTTEMHAPYIKRRLLVEKKEEIELSPIDIAITKIRKRTVALLEEVHKVPPNSKTLQPALSGSINVVVNKGTAEYLEEFLRDNSAAYPEKKVQTLVRRFTSFLDACAEGLALNAKITGADLAAFHSDLEGSFEATVNTVFQAVKRHLSKQARKKFVKKYGVKEKK